MTALEICLIIIGIAAIGISYFISEKTSQERLKKAADNLVLSEESKQSLKQQTREAVAAFVADMSDGIGEKAERELEKVSNEKIMAVHDYSDTVLNEINKNHNEVMFLYSMLDDKDKEVKETARDVHNVVKTIKRLEQAFTAKEEHLNQVAVQITAAQADIAAREQQIIEAAEQVMRERKRLETVEAENKISVSVDLERTEEIPDSDVPEEGLAADNVEAADPNVSQELEQILKPFAEEQEDMAVKEDEAELEAILKEENQAAKSQGEVVSSMSQQEEKNNNEIILRLYKEGKSKVEIAKEMGLGVGEVKLVIDLFQEVAK